MVNTVTIKLLKPIKSVEILDDGDQQADCSLPPDEASAGYELNGSEASNVPRVTPSQDLEAQKTAFMQSCRVLNGVVGKLNEFCEKIFAEHREEIARLSVEIARKILMQKVQDGDYEIESIIKEALKNIPTRQDVVVHVNPEDFNRCQKAGQDEPNGILSGIKFVSDPNIGRAECLVESPKGIIRSLIDEHLEQIGKALQKAE